MYLSFFLILGLSLKRPFLKIFLILLSITLFNTSLLLQQNFKIDTGFFSKIIFNIYKSYFPFLVDDFLYRLLTMSCLTLISIFLFFYCFAIKITFLKKIFLKFLNFNFFNSFDRIRFQKVKRTKPKKAKAARKPNKMDYFRKMYDDDQTYFDEYITDKVKKQIAKDNKDAWAKLSGTKLYNTQRKAYYTYMTKNHETELQAGKEEYIQKLQQEIDELTKS